MAVDAAFSKISQQLTFTQILLWLTISSIQLRETECAVPIDIKFLGTVTVTKKPPSWIIRVIPDVVPLISPSRKHFQLSQRTKPQNVADFFKVIYVNDHPNKLHKLMEEETDNWNILNHQYIPSQNVYQTVKRFDSDSQERFQQGSRYSNELINSEESQRSREVDKYYFYNKQHHNSHYNFQKLHQVPGKSTNIQDMYNDLLRLLINRTNFKKLQQVTNNKFQIDDDDDLSHLDTQRTLNDDVDKTNNYRSKIEDKSLVSVENDDYSNNKYIREDVSVENQDLNSEAEHRRHRRQYTPLPAPETAEGRPNEILEADNDIYYNENTRYWDKPLPGDDYHPEDPRSPKSPFTNQTWRVKYIPGRFYNDDYQTFLGPDENPYKPWNLLHGQAIFIGQAIPILKSMILGKGLEQGPSDAPYRIHWQDLKYYDKEDDIPPPPTEGPRRLMEYNTNANTIKHNQPKIIKKPQGNIFRNNAIKHLAPKTFEKSKPYLRKIVNPTKHFQPKTLRQKIKPKRKFETHTNVKRIPRWKQIDLANRRTFENHTPNVASNSENENDNSKYSVNNIRRCYRPNSDPNKVNPDCLENPDFTPKKLDWWPSKNKIVATSPEKEKLFTFDKNKNYTIIINVF